MHTIGLILALLIMAAIYAFDKILFNLISQYFDEEEHKLEDKK
ncbi:hypothetical protein ES705_12808 [subsurface metagenome]